MCTPIELLNVNGAELRKVLVLYTGGTIGMLPDNGNGSLAPREGALVKRLRLLEELDESRMPKCYLTEFNPLLDSADMAPPDWNNIAKVIADYYYEYDGFIVLHGTDTMAYTASALSFMLEQLAKPVILTGAQIPLFEPLNDARQNFLGAVVFAGLGDLAEVCVYFNGKLMRGNRCSKVNAVSLDAFQSPSYPVLAEMGTDIHIYDRRLRDPPKGAFRVQAIQASEITVMWVIPGFSDEFLESMVACRTVKGLIIRFYGCGNAPAKKAGFLSYLKALCDSGVVVVACSQCQQGTVSLSKYGVGKALHDIGVISAQDMSTEAAVTKLSYLFSKGLSTQQCRIHMERNIRGELTTERNLLSISEPTTGLNVSRL